jgi:hypothetical protein
MAPLMTSDCAPHQVLLDRLLFVREQGLENATMREIFDPRESPRNTAIIAGVEVLGSSAMPDMEVLGGSAMPDMEVLGGSAMPNMEVLGGSALDSRSRAGGPMGGPCTPCVE